MSGDRGEPLALSDLGLIEGRTDSGLVRLAAPDGREVILPAPGNPLDFERGEFVRHEMEAGAAALLSGQGQGVVYDSSRNR